MPGRHLLPLSGANAVAVLAVAAVAAACGGRATVGTADLVPSALSVQDSVLKARIVSLAERSPTWRAGLDTLRQNGFRAIIGTPADIREQIPEMARYSPDHIGEVIPLRTGSGEIAGAIVTVDLRRLERLYRGTNLPVASFHADIERILIHEIFGHLVPLSQTRSIEGGCPDPRPGEPALSSCAIQRENQIRQELGMELRRTYDILGLEVGRYYYRHGSLSGTDDGN